MLTSSLNSLGTFLLSFSRAEIVLKCSSLLSFNNSKIKLSVEIIVAPEEKKKKKMDEENKKKKMG